MRREEARRLAQQWDDNSLTALGAHFRRLEAEQGIRFNFQAMGVPHDGHGKALVPASQWPKARIFDAASWNGLDLLAYPEVLFKGPNTILHCTERLVELAKRDGWTNVEFQWRHVE